jgi:3-hydroxybutyrate dehydrogenase
MGGTFLFTRAVLRAMEKQQEGMTAEQMHAMAGKIIIMGSVHSKEASVLKSSYVAAKHGTDDHCVAWGSNNIIVMVSFKACHLDNMM